MSAEELASLAASAGIRRVHLVAWRDLDDPEAGGSELHAHMVCRRWAEAGLDVTIRTSHAPNHPPEKMRDGYRAVRRGGRYLVFPRAAAVEALRRNGDYDALVEIWNGMPFFSPLWVRRPHAVWLHHVHAEMWNMVLPPGLASAGRILEARVAPRIYRRSRIVTLSESSRRELVGDLGFSDDLVSVVPPGIDSKFSPGGQRSVVPLVVAVGRLAPVKRFERLIRILAEVRTRVPELTAVIVGEGYEREALEDLIRQLGAGEWLRLAGHVSDEELVDLYRQAWVVASASAREGWGMTLTEAAACGTPAVATRISGHEDAVVHDSTGLLGSDDRELVEHMGRVLTDDDLRHRLSLGALAHASALTWDATARGTLAQLVMAAEDRRRRG